MKFFTKKSVTQKIIIILLLVISFNFIAPKPIQADAGGIFLSPLFAFVGFVLDQGQHLMEWAMLGEWGDFMRDKSSGGLVGDGYKPNGDAVIDLRQFEASDGGKLQFDGELLGAGDYSVPVIQYSPEEIFANRVPALDANFINPSVRGGNEEKHIAQQLQGLISSWYVAIRTLSIVGLLSVLLYLGIRMMLTSVAADRAKYKKMMMDWVVAMCLVFALHYIMSFALTICETITAMIGGAGTGQTITVIVPDGTTFQANLIGYVRFMMQCTDLQQKVTFLLLYIMLLIYTVRFTWIYLKRVVNMAFLTLIAPLVALTYPIDKVSDGKAQAFDMWIKEFSFNALIQPVHLLLYTVLVGSGIQIAANNPIYAIVCLGFIIAAEKLVKQMFGFNKASGGTLGSLAGAAGVTAMAGKALNSLGSGKGGGAGKGKVRTKDIPERTGKDKGANSPYDAFKNRTADQAIGAGGTGEEVGEKTGTGVGAGENDIPVPPPSDDTHPTGGVNPGSNTGAEGEGDDGVGGEDGTSGAPEADLKDAFATSGEQELGFFDTVKGDVSNFGGRIGAGLSGIKKNVASLKTEEGRRNLKNSISDGVRKRAIGAWKAAPTAAYKAARGTLRAASRVALAGAMGGIGLAIGATTGDGEKALSMAMGAAGVGMATGDNLFDASLGKVMPNKSVRDAYGAGKYGNKIDARNARADKEYFRSEKFDNFYEKEFKGKLIAGKQVSKSDFKRIVEDYRKAGITSEKDIKKALKLENEYYKNNDGLDEKDRRAQIQNIVQEYNSMDSYDRRAFTGDDKAKANKMAEIKAAVGGDEQLAKQIFQGYLDYRKQ